MKDCFAKELAAQGKSGQAAPSKKKKYIHFDSMLFLIPSMQKRETSGNLSSPNSTQDANTSSHFSTQDITLSTTAQNSQLTNNNRTPLRKKSCSRDNNNSTEIDQQLLDILKDKQAQEEEDEEKNFALMLVPMLRRLNEDQKHYAKIEILNVLKKARTHSSPQPLQHVVDQPAQFRGPKIASSPLYHQTYFQPQYQYSPQSSSMDTIYSIQSPSPTMPPPSPSPQSSTTIQQAPAIHPTMPQKQIQIIDQQILKPANETADYLTQFVNQLEDH